MRRTKAWNGPMRSFKLTQHRHPHHRMRMICLVLEEASKFPYRLKKHTALQLLLLYKLSSHRPVRSRIPHRIVSSNSLPTRATIANQLSKQLRLTSSTHKTRRSPLHIMAETTIPRTRKTCQPVRLGLSWAETLERCHRRSICQCILTHFKRY